MTFNHLCAPSALPLRLCGEAFPGLSENATLHAPRWVYNSGSRENVSSHVALGGKPAFGPWSVGDHQTASHR